MQLKVKSVGNTNPSGRGMNGNVFDSDYLCPTLTTNKGEGIKILIKNATKKGYLIAEEGDGIDTAYPESKTRRGRVQKNIAHTLTTDDSKAVIIQKPRGFNKGGTHINSPSITKSSLQENNFLIVASRGRDPKNPSDRKAGNSNLEQRLEINKNGTSNTITSVQKDNYAVELPEYRIRKLTPKECWRLMGCSDEDFEKAEQVNSNSQLYKQAGNAIVVDVLEAIFSQLFLKKRNR